MMMMMMRDLYICKNNNIYNAYVSIIANKRQRETSAPKKERLKVPVVVLLCLRLVPYYECVFIPLPYF